MFLNAHELISLKLLAIGLAKDQATNWTSYKRALFSVETLEKVGNLLITVT
jgi:hypothetical protein